MSADKHLWEYDHPYYCAEGNYLYAPYQHAGRVIVHEGFDSWRHFKAVGMFDADRDLNLLFRWDWHAWHLEDPENFPDGEAHELHLFFMLQRKAFNRSATVSVTPADEREVRAWLEECAETVRAIWAPLLGASS